MLCPTSKSLTHTDARRAASAAGARVGTLPGVTEDIMVRCMNADYHRIAERTHRLCALMEETAAIRVQVARPAPTSVAHRRTAGAREQRAVSGTRTVGQSADRRSLPGAARRTVERRRRRRRFDGGRRRHAQPIRIVVENGYATDITGGRRRRSSSRCSSRTAATPATSPSSASARTIARR